MQPLPIVVLGDPGMGKTKLLLKLGEQPDYHYLTAAQFLRRPLSRLGGGVLVLDALDEVSAGRDSDPLDLLLLRLAEAGSPPFILSCRAADWQGSAQAKAIADDYGRPALILTLEPLSEEEGKELLAEELGPVAAQEFHGALAEHGLSELLRNPQSLAMLLDVAPGGVPTGRADLFERASAKMVAEHNEAHVRSATNRLDPSLILDGAGAAMAMLLLSGKEGLSAGLQQNAPPQMEHVARIASLPLAAHCSVALKTRLFQASLEHDGSTYCHRTIAEYLGARWLGRVVDGCGDPDRMTKRLIALIHAGTRVPASLRGLHAWLAHHSRHFAAKVIRNDPYGVIRYGDLGAITKNVAIEVWNSLARVARHDPWFRAGDWQRFAITGLVQEGLGEHLSRLLEDAGSSFHLRSLILDLLPGAGCLPELSETFLEIVRDPARTYSERLDALLLVPKDECGNKWPAIVLDLCHSGDRDAPRLAEEAILHLGVGGFSDADIVEVIFALCGGRAQALCRHSYEDFWSMTKAIPVERCARLLDVLADRFGTGAEWAALAKRHVRFGHLVWTLVVRQIPAGSPDPKRVWRWLNAFADHYGSEPGTKAKISAWLEGNDALRQAVQKLMFASEEGARSLQAHNWHVGSLSHGLYCQAQDVVPLLGALARSGRRDALEHEAFGTIVRGWALRCDWTKPMGKAAEHYAAGDAKLLTILHPPPKPRQRRESGALEEFAKRQRKAEQRRERRKQADRAAMLAKLDNIRDGRGLAAPLALCFLGYGEFGGREIPNVERIDEWVGQDLQHSALEGFEASLQRPVGTTLHALTERLIARDDQSDPIWPVVAGLAQRHLDGRGLSDVGEDHVLACLIAKRLNLTVVDKHLEGFGDALEQFVTSEATRFERFLRALMEPQLPTDRYAVTGTHYLLGGKDHHVMRTRLLLDWFDRLSGRIGWDDQALAGALLDAPTALRVEAGARVDELIAEGRPRYDGADDTPYWTALRILRDFDHARPSLEARAEDPAFIWKVRKAVGHDRFGGGRMRPMPVDRLAWIFERFERHWPNAEHPRGTSSGTENPWDASDFLGAVLFRIAEDTSPVAMRTLNDLTTRGSASYDETLRAARARQRAKASEELFSPPGLDIVAAALREAPPKSAADIKAIVMDALERLQTRIAGSATNPVDLFYDVDTPKNEERCRDALLELLGTSLPFGITWAPEERMPDGKRADAGFRCGETRVPMEIKLDRNRFLWTAAADQLDRLYASADYMAGGQGIYLVFWFGPDSVSRASIPSPPNGDAPESGRDLQRMLNDQLGSAGDRLSVIVVDVSRRTPA